MSVVLEFSIFPTDKGESVSLYVSKVIKMIRGLDIKHQLTPMGTIIETETLKEALNVIEKSYDILKKENAQRVYISTNIDIRVGKNNRLEQKIKSINDKI